VTAFQAEVGEPQHLVRDFGKDGMAVFEEGVEGTGEPIVVEFLGRNVAEIFNAVFASPFGDVYQSGRMMKSGKQQDVDDGAVGELGLRIGRDMAIDDAGQVELLEQGHENGKRTEVNDGLLA